MVCGFVAGMFCENHSHSSARISQLLGETTIIAYHALELCNQHIRNILNLQKKTTRITPLCILMESRLVFQEKWFIYTIVNI